MDRRLLQREVARDMGVAVESVRLWETGKVEPGIRQVAKIIRFLGCDPSPGPRTFAELLVAVRRTLGVSQRGLATLLRVDSSSVWAWETGRRRPSENLRRAVEQRLREATPAIVRQEGIRGQPTR
jgi:DNA-binding transcriptional regulator YiaG